MPLNKAKQFLLSLKPLLTPKQLLLPLLGSAILAFGLCHIHAHSGVTEGGVLGMTLLLDYHFAISPAISSLVLNVLCYLWGAGRLGKRFIVISIVASLGYSAFYALFDLLPPLFPWLYSRQLLAALLGAVFVGVGAGLCVRAGGAPGGDDALAMCLSDIFHISIRWAYLSTDLVVLALSLTYIAPAKILYSLVTVILSGQLVGLVTEGKEYFKKKRA